MSTWNKHYHWKTKGCTAWSKQYFVDHLVTSDASSASASASASSSSTNKQPAPHPLSSGTASELHILKLSNFEGDVELGNRKGKLITIYDIDMTLQWVVKTEADGEQVEVAKGSLRFPEVSHEISDSGDEYTWETTLDDDCGDKSRAEVVYKEVKKGPVVGAKLVPVLEAFRERLIETHSKDLGHEGQAQAGGSGASSGAATPVTAKASGSATPATKSSSSSSAAAAVTTSSDSITVSSLNACSAADLWDLLTNAARIPMWTRAPATFSPTVGSSFSLFNNNVTGKVKVVQPPSHLVLDWRAPTWPTDHFGTLTIDVEQKPDGADLKLTLTGVPDGEEERSKDALDEFYINGMRRIGLGTMI